MIEPDDISTMLTSELIDFVQSTDDDGDRWLIFYTCGMIVIELSATGEHLLIRTGPIADATEIPPGERVDLYRRAMLANDQLKIGRYCGVDEICFEIGMALPGQSSLSAEQLILGIQTAAAIGCVGKKAL